MRQQEALQADTSNDCQKDPFDEVMKDDHNGYVRLMGKGVSRKKMKGKGADKSLTFPTEIMDSIKANVQKDMICSRGRTCQETGST